MPGNLSPGYGFCFSVVVFCDAPVARSEPPTTEAPLKRKQSGPPWGFLFSKISPWGPVAFCCQVPTPQVCADLVSEVARILF